jgi:hypothetical protein
MAYIEKLSTVAPGKGPAIWPVPYFELTQEPASKFMTAPFGV